MKQIYALSKVRKDISRRIVRQLPLFCARLHCEIPQPQEVYLMPIQIQEFN